MIRKPKTLKKLILFLLGFFISTSGFAFKVVNEQPVNGQEPTESRIEEGSKLFSQNCASCHTLDKKLIGPGLTGVVSKYDSDFEYLIKWIQNNAALISSGDPRAIEASKFAESDMNIFGFLTDEQVTSILMWIENGGDGNTPLVDEQSKDTVVEVDESLFNKINWGIVILALLVFIILVLLVGILELVGNVTGRQIINWNNVNAFMMMLFIILFFVLVFYEYSVHSKYLLPEASSEHGKELDRMMRWTFIATIPVFFITQFLLFYFSFRYRQKPGRKAFYYPHNNRLEYIWTTIPAVVLTVLVLGGLKSWKNIVKSNPPEDASQIEVFAFQFGWQARYPGEDGELGYADYNLIWANNPMGVANREDALNLLKDLEEQLVNLQRRIDKDLPREEAELRASLGGLVGKERKEHLRKINEYSSGQIKNDLELTIRARKTQIARITKSLKSAGNKLYTGKGDDDVMVGEIHLVKDKPVTLKFRARDVIHSAYLPYFRAQMNVVPGLPTEFTFVPTKSTKEMRDDKNDPEWNYYLVCNKICGNSHFNMKIIVIVEDQTSYDEWLKTQNPLFAEKETEPTEQSEGEMKEQSDSTENVVEGDEIVIN